MFCFPRASRLLTLSAVALVLTTGGVVFGPAPAYAARVSTHIDSETPALSAPPTGAGADTTSAPARPLAPLQAQLQAQASQPGRLRATSVGIAAFTLLGISAETPRGTGALVRVRHGDTWSDWAELDFDGGDAPDPDSAEARRAAKATHGRPTTEGVWFGPSDGYEISLPAGSSALTVHLAREKTTRAPVTVDPPVATASTPDANRPVINPRSSWGARPPKEAYDYARSVEHAVVHHSVTQNVYSPADVPAILRSIQAFHQDTRGWNDIAYNFAVDKFGGVWEARGGGITSTVIGGHALGANTGTTGIVTLGDFSTASPPQAMVDSVGDLIGWKLYIHGVNPSGAADYRIRATDRYVEGTHVVLASVIGHRDVGLTGCPGDFLYPRLDEIRARATAKWVQMKFDLLVSNQLATGIAEATTRYHLPGGTRLLCDWNGDGRDTPGAYRDGIWYLTDDPTGGDPTRTVGYGDPGDVPICGDWNGDGVDTPGIVRNGAWYLVNTIGKPTADKVFGYGDPTDEPIVGDWDGSGTDTPGIVRNGAWYLVNILAKPIADTMFGYGDPTDKPIVGDWDGNGTDTPGIVRNGLWFLTNTLGKSVADLNFAYGNPDDHAIVGDWNGDGTDSPGVIRFP